MAKKSLFLDFEYDFDFELVCLVSSMRDYRLCWFINQALNLDFSRQEEIVIDFPKKRKQLFFNHYAYYDELSRLQYDFMPNKNGADFLIPELKQVDYFLMINGGSATLQKEDMITTLKQIRQIEAIFDKDPNTLPSKQNLILE